MDKKCWKCKEIKSDTEFYRNRSKHDGLSCNCKTCNKIACKEWYRRNPEKNIRWGRDAQLRRLYGITLEEYEAMVVSQNGVCAICDKPETAGKLGLAVDHCHCTGKVRGLLCCRCNRTLGSMRDNPQLLRKAAAYLEKP